MKDSEIGLITLPRAVLGAISRICTSFCAKKDLLRGISAQNCANNYLKAIKVTPTVHPSSSVEGCVL
jgi:hypothetical protein